MTDHRTRQDFLNALSTSLSDGTFISLTMSKPSGPVSEDRIQRETVRPVEVKGQLLYQLTRQYAKRETHENLDAEQIVERVALGLGGVLKHAHLYTTEADLAARASSPDKCRMTVSSPTKRAARSVTHDREKSHLIPEDKPCSFLHELGVMTAAGRVHRSKRDKFKQINRFLEFVEDVIPHLPSEGTIEVIDFGCGLSYLTFALHHLLTVIHNREVHILGIDQNRQVIDRCTETCRSLRLEGMEFCAETINHRTDNRKVHLAVALHACDTATDDALAQAVRWGADVILAAPCCQHELAPQLKGDALRLITQHGILRERLAAMATDALRAAILEQAGYRTQIIEFIDTEHTPKNLLLRAIRRGEVTPVSSRQPEIEQLKLLLGIDHLSLEDLLRDANDDDTFDS